ncbi:hypothetical protein P2S53_16470, partial [Escherichia coli]
DRNRSHWSTSKTPSYTKSVSWQHHPSEGINRITLYITYPAPIVAPVARAASVVDSPEVLHDRSLLGSGSKPYFFAHFLMLFGADE